MKRVLWLLVLVHASAQGFLRFLGADQSSSLEKTSAQQQAQQHLFQYLDRDRDDQLEISELQQYFKEIQGTDIVAESIAPELAAVLSAQLLDGQDPGDTISSNEFELYLSEVFKSCTVAEWVEHGLNLPQYADAFRQQAVMALDLPLLIEGGADLLKELQVTSPFHQRRLLAAMNRLVLGAGQPPSGVRNVTCKPHTCGGVLLEWHPPAEAGQPPLHKFTVARTESASGQLPIAWAPVGEVVSAAGSDHVRFHDAGAHHGRAYDYRVAAWNLMGSSEPVVVVGCAAPAWWKSTWHRFSSNTDTCAAGNVYVQPPGRAMPLVANGVPAAYEQPQHAATATGDYQSGGAAAGQGASLQRGHAVQWFWTAVSAAGAVLSLLVRVHPPTRHAVLHVLATCARKAEGLPRSASRLSRGLEALPAQGAAGAADQSGSLQRQLSVIQEGQPKEYSQAGQEQYVGEDGAPPDRASQSSVVSLSLPPPPGGLQGVGGGSGGVGEHVPGSNGWRISGSTGSGSALTMADAGPGLPVELGAQEPGNGASNRGVWSQGSSGVDPDPPEGTPGLAHITRGHVARARSDKDLYTIPPGTSAGLAGWVVQDAAGAGRDRMRKSVSLASLRERRGEAGPQEWPQVGHSASTTSAPDVAVGDWGDGVCVAPSGGSSEQLQRQGSLRAVVQDLSKCGQPGCTVTWPPPWQLRLGPRRAKHYCGRCQHFYCLDHTAYSNHGAFGACNRESACLCVDCFARLPERARAKLAAQNTLTAFHAKQAAGNSRSGSHAKAKRAMTKIAAVRALVSAGKRHSLSREGSSSAQSGEGEYTDKETGEASPTAGNGSVSPRNGWPRKSRSR